MQPRRDPRLEAAIRAVDRWRDRDVGVTPMGRGRDAHHYLIEAGNEPFVLREADLGASISEDAARTELEIARAAAVAGVGPEVIAWLPQLGCLVTRYAQGRPLTAGDADDPATLAALVGSLRAMHAIPPPLVRLDDGAERDDGADGLRPAVTIHANLTRERLLLDRGHIWIVDYRWARAGDAFDDLARTAAVLRLSPEQVDAMLERYMGDVGDADRDRLHRLVAIEAGALRG